MENIDLEKRLDQMLLEDKSIGLLTGKMGVCIYFFVMSHHDKASRFYHKAEKLLSELLRTFSFNHGLDMKDGLTGFVLGLIFLYRKQYIQVDYKKKLLFALPQHMGRQRIIDRKIWISG